MRVLVLTQFFLPETGAASERTTAIVHRFRSDGHDVTVLTAMPSFPSGRLDLPYRGKAHLVERLGGARVERRWTYTSPKQRRVDRLLNWSTAAVGMTLSMFLGRVRGERYELVVVSFPPITQALVGLLARPLFGARLAVDVRDVLTTRGPELGLWRAGSPADRIVRTLSRLLYDGADVVSTVSETARGAIIASGVAPEKVLLFTNGFDRWDGTTASPYARDEAETVVAYVGTLGLTSGVDLILETAKRMAPARRIRFVIAGDGTERARLEQRARDEHIDAVTFLGARSSDEAKALQRHADLALVPLRASVVDALPKKMFDALSVGTPVVVSARGEAARFIECSGGGVVVPPEDAAALARALEELAADRERCRRLGAAGQAYVFAHFEREVLVKRYVDRVVAAV